MRAILLVILIPLLLLCILSPLPSVEAAPGRKESVLARGEVGKSIVAWARSAEEAGFSGVVFASVKGKPVAAVGVGYADLAGKVPNTPDTLFEIASVSKPVTAVVVMRLVDQGKLALDDSIAKHLPGIPDDCKGITVRHLLQHTSGIPGTNSRGGGTDLGRVLKTFLKGGPRHEPGTHWEYWNQGYALLSEIIARVSGKSYVAFSKQTLFKPLRMTSSCFTGDAPPSKARVAIGRSSRGAPRSALDHPYGEYGFQYRGMGGVVTNVFDLHRLDRALDGKKLLSERARKAMFEPGLKDYALGWFVKKKNGRLVQSHTGGVRGFICDVRRYPEHDACVFVLCNSNDAPLHTVAEGVEQLLFGEALTQKLAKTMDEATAEAMVGTYAAARGTKLTIERRGKNLVGSMIWPAGMRSRMTFGLDAEGKLAMFQGDKAYPVQLGPLKDGKAPWLTILGERYARR